ncbi:MAG TPA: 3-phosphoglycerate dehydrogenase family protein [Bacillota bacterium]|nr:3-phosphoglycerate dehydrogenase family protein [Bacillota bacterium]HQJ38196.1 3-phosphoglycerate dehydrogenase family protein [Bacillota bacterium]HRU41190.1 3-phosphoglycerate dehydrogenase family protein [Candidatus Diapherotrites archaeon]
MYNIKLLNRISSKGLENLEKRGYYVSQNADNPDAIILRSFSMHEMELPRSLKAIARAGAGVNNIPVDKCTEKGIVVFNTPGANANAVKELTILALLMSSRKVVDSILWSKSLSGIPEDIKVLIEKEKGRFVGPEIKGKKLGVIGLGAIGVMVANAAGSLGMEVKGYDPYISIDSAWGLSRSVKKAESLKELLEGSDYITLHVPFMDSTRNMIDNKAFKLMKRGVRLLNFSREGLVDNAELKKALNEGIVETYATDFPDEELIRMDNVISFPHIGASTLESEENCAVMASNQIKCFLEWGTIKNSVNFPNCDLGNMFNHRITLSHLNIPNMVGQITGILASKGLNIENMINKSRDKVAYTIIDTDTDIPDDILGKLENIDSMIRVRKL